MALGKRIGETVKSYFCIKQFSTTDGKLEEARDKLTNEIVALRYLGQDCSYMVNMEEVIKTEHNLWLVMELCNGGTLQ